jgi:hypothetical protein
MPIRPSFLTRAKDGDPSPTTADATPDYRAYDDDELLVERDRQQRRLEELTLHPDPGQANCSRLVGIDGEVERITDEMIRRARSRHPSSGGLAS